MIWIDEDYVYPLEETFGDMCDKGFTFPNTLFYNEGNRKDFENMFKRHFKYNRIAYPSEKMFKDMYQDILDVNYPKYKHYWDTLERAKTLEWWNNKDLVTIFDGQIDTNDVKDFTTTLDKLEKLTSNLIKTGDVTNQYERSLKVQTNEKGTDKKDALNKNKSSSSNDGSSESRNENTTNSTNRFLDTPQGQITNIERPESAGYLTNATLDNSAEIDTTQNASRGKSESTSEDTNASTGSNTKDTIELKTGNAQDKKIISTSDKNNKDTTGKDTTKGKEENTGFNKEDYTKTEKGNIGITSAGKLVNDWLKYGYININKMIIRDCETLFLQIY